MSSLLPSPFEAGQQNKLNLKERPAAEPGRRSSAPAPGGVDLPAPKPKRKPFSLYLDTEMMDRVKQVARHRGVTIGAVIEACVKMALEQLEG